MMRAAVVLAGHGCHSDSRACHGDHGPVFRSRSFQCHLKGLGPRLVSEVLCDPNENPIPLAAVVSHCDSLSTPPAPSPLPLGQPCLTHPLTPLSDACLVWFLSCYWEALNSQSALCLWLVSPTSGFLESADSADNPPAVIDSRWLLCLEWDPSKSSV